jgi:DNA repair protein RadC
MSPRSTGFDGMAAAMLIATAEDAAALLQPFVDGRPDDHVAVLHLDGAQRVIAVTPAPREEAEAGGLPVAAILRAALRLGADGIVVAYAHSAGGGLEPSDGERESTRRLAEAAAAMGVRLMDQLLFVSGECRSYRALGLL